MVDPVGLHKPIEILEPKRWEITLTQLRALMKNEVVNHDRIRQRVIELKERYYEGEMEDGAVNWGKWAINHFAYSSRHLRRLSSPHPLQIDKWEAQKIREEHRLQRLWAAEDKKRAQAAWDQWREDRRHEQEKLDKKEAKRLYYKEFKRVQREAAKKCPVSQNHAVISQMAEQYKALPRGDQNIFLGLIGAQRLTKQIRHR